MPRRYNFIAFHGLITAWRFRPISRDARAGTDRGQRDSVLILDSRTKNEQRTRARAIAVDTKPNIVISSLDAERLEALLDALPANAFPGKDALEAELARADIVPPDQVPPSVITMNSTVRFRVESSNQQFTLTLVYPKDMDSSSEKISILAPVGGALLGLSVGDSIDWPKPGGGMIRVRVEDVLYQPERAGEYHR